MWFGELVGFSEGPPDQVRAQITVEGGTMISAINGRRMGCGTLDVPSSATEPRPRQ